jgi:hypothetical protein
MPPGSPGPGVDGHVTPTYMHLGAMHVVGGEVGQGGAAAVFELHPPGGQPWCRWLSAVASLEGLQLGFLISADDVYVGAEGLALPGTCVAVQDPDGFDGEVGVTGEDPGPVLPGFDALHSATDATVHLAVLDHDQGPVRGRTDLPGTGGARCADRPTHLLGAPVSGTVDTRVVGHHHRRDPRRHL